MTTLTTTISSREDWSLSYDEEGGGVGGRRDDVGASDASGANTRVNYAESETEDEEVKMNCIAGARGMEDSDMFSDCEGVDIDDNNDDNDNDNDNDEGSQAESEADGNVVEGSHEGVVSFVSNRLRNAAPLVHPKATTPPSRASLSPLEEEEASDDSTESSVGARGVALSLGTGSVSSSDSSSADEMEDAEDVDDEEAAVGTGITHDDEVEDGYSGEKEDSDHCDDEDEDDGDDDEDGFEYELSGLLETLECVQDSSDHDDDAGSERHIGVTMDRDDIINIPKTKRVLSFNTLTALNTEIGLIRDSPKRSKVDADRGGRLPLVSFSLGPPAMTDDITKDARLEFRFRRESPLVSSSDDEELDRQLEAELGDRDEDVRGCGGSTGSSGSRENSPVPLLTPPESPVVFEMNGDKNVTICEWPSNLVVDSALTSVAISEIEPLTPSALEDFERDASERPVAQASSLTPLLRGISFRDL